MKYRIIGDTMPAVEVMFDVPGECMYTQSGGMAWMSDGIEMATNTRGGFMKGLGRMFAGESLFMATYRAQRPGIFIILFTVLSFSARMQSPAFWAELPETAFCKTDRSNSAPAVQSHPAAGFFCIRPGKDNHIRRFCTLPCFPEIASWLRMRGR